MTNTVAVRPRTIRQIEIKLFSQALNREVYISVLLPSRYRLNVLRYYPLVILNDGQDFAALRLRDRYAEALATGRVAPMIIVGIHANHDRMREYGTSKQLDYGGRGDMADAHRRFVVKELLPLLKRKYRTRSSRKFVAIGGFSLGALSAFDIAWNHEINFGHVGCFSASFWWRSTPFNDYNPDENRIAIERAKYSVRAPDLSYYFQVGTDEETSDRNNNGIIDVIDDTIDMIGVLREQGVPGRDITYRLVEGGEHNQATWGPAIIEWLSELF